jgi:hypothetical protein
MNLPPVIIEKICRLQKKKGVVIDIDYEEHGLFYHKLDLLIEDKYTVKVSFSQALPAENTGIMKRISWCTDRGMLGGLTQEVREWLEVIFSRIPGSMTLNEKMIKKLYSCYSSEIDRDRVTGKYLATFNTCPVLFIYPWLGASKLEEK